MKIWNKIIKKIDEETGNNLPISFYPTHCAGDIIDNDLYVFGNDNFVIDNIKIFENQILHFAREHATIEKIVYRIGNIQTLTLYKEKSQVQSKQLKLKFTYLSNTQCLFPNHWIRNSLFSMVKKGIRKKYVNEKLASYNDVELYFTGEQLDQNDLDVLLVIIKLFFKKNQNNDLYTYEEIKVSEILNFLKIPAQGQMYEIINNRVERLVNCTLKIIMRDKSNKQQVKLTTHLIMSYIEVRTEKTKDARFSIHKDAINLFNEGSASIIDIEERVKLKNDQLAKWLLMFYSTHKEPIDFSLSKIQSYCKSTYEPYKFKAQVLEKLEKINPFLKQKGYQLEIIDNNIVPIYFNRQRII